MDKDEILFKTFEILESENDLIPKKYRQLYNKKFLRTDTLYKKLITYVENNLKESQQQEVKDILEEYFGSVDDYCRYSEKLYFISGASYATKSITALYNL